MNFMPHLGIFENILTKQKRDIAILNSKNRFMNLSMPESQQCCGIPACEKHCVLKGYGGSVCAFLTSNGSFARHRLRLQCTSDEHACSFSACDLARLQDPPEQWQ